MTEPVASSGRRTTLVTLIVAISLFMQNLDGTILSTAIPTMAREFRINPIDLKLALTAYLLALAISFRPRAGWPIGSTGGSFRSPPSRSISRTRWRWAG